MGLTEQTERAVLEDRAVDTLQDDDDDDDVLGDISSVMVSTHAA